MDRLIRKVIEFFLRNKAISEEDIEIYEYGLSVLFTDIAAFTVAFVAALFFNIVIQTLLYHVAFIGLRQYAGGYHASTRARCFVASTATWLASMWLVTRTAPLTVLSFAFALVTCFVVWLFAPVEHANNPLGPKQRVRLRRKSRFYSLALAGVVLFGVALIPLKIPHWVSASLSYGMISFACSLLLTKALERHRNGHGEGSHAQ